MINKLKNTVTVLLLASTCIANIAIAEVITFEEFAPTSNISNTTLQLRGYDLVLNNKASVHNSGCGVPSCVSNDSQYLAVAYFGDEADFIIERSDGKPFELKGFDAAEYRTGNHGIRDKEIARKILVTGYTTAGGEGGVVTQEFILDWIYDGVSGENDFQSFILSNQFVDLVSVKIEGIDGDTGNSASHNTFSIDNIDLSDAPYTVTHNGYTLDSETNIISNGTLDWMQWDETDEQSMTMLEAVAANSGWRIATNVEVAGLMSDFFPNQTWLGDPTIEHNYDDIPDQTRSFTYMFGTTSGNSSSRAMHGIGIKSSTYSGEENIDFYNLIRINAYPCIYTVTGDCPNGDTKYSIFMHDADRDVDYPLNRGGVGTVLVRDATDSKTVEIDIKPYRYNKCFDINLRGAIPTAIMGAEDFDVKQIKLSSLSLAGLNVKKRWYSRRPQCYRWYINNDEHLDLICKFEKNSSKWEPEGDNAILTGKMKDGSTFEGTDQFCLIGQE